jgi:hypothetical protein
VTGDAYRARVRAMTALDHFATDHLPLDAAARECLCDAEPGVFAVFAFAVLAMHQTRQPVYSGTAMCSCGQSVVTCPVQSLARRLLFAPTPAPQVEAADRGGTA